MNKPKDKIEELFQSHRDDFDKMPDDSLWENIEANLPPAATPNYRPWRWGLAAALLLFSLVAYVAYESLSSGQKVDGIGDNNNNQKSDLETSQQMSEKDAKSASEANESNLVREYVTKETIAAREAKNDKIVITDNAGKKEKISDRNKADKSANNEVSIAPNLTRKSSELLTQKSIHKKGDKDHERVVQEIPERVVDLVSKDTEVGNIEKNQAIGEEENKQSIAISENEETEKLTTPKYLFGHERSVGNAIPINTRIAYETEYHPVEEKESFFKIPSEGYVSFTPSLSYYRVFSSMPINQFNGANNGGRLGWAVQAGVVYPLKLRRFSYRVGLSFFSAQSNFKYNVLNGRQQPIRLNNNTFEYGNIESTQSESKRWQVLEIQNDLLYKVRPMQDFVLGFKAGGSLGEKPVFDAYTGYRFSRALSHRQAIWIEVAYAYAINGMQSSKNAFSYHMDKYSLKIGMNYR